MHLARLGSRSRLASDEYFIGVSPEYEGLKVECAILLIKGGNRPANKRIEIVLIGFVTFLCSPKENPDSYRDKRKGASKTNQLFDFAAQGHRLKAIEELVRTFAGPPRSEI